MKYTNSNLYPMISCLCVTHNKPEMLARAIRHFFLQSYLNKQLVIVYQQSDIETLSYITNNKFSDAIKIICVPKEATNQTLGNLRNLSINHADGDYICQWDDDDCYHPDRLKKQYEFIRNNNIDACVLEQWIVYNACSEKFHISNKRLWEGSLMCKTLIAKRFTYPSIVKGEDSCIINYLVEHRIIKALQNHPELYIYVYHGNNTWDEDHFNLIFKFSTELKNNDLKLVSQLINA